MFFGVGQLKIYYNVKEIKELKLKKNMNLKSIK